MDLRFLIRSVNWIRRGNPRNRNRKILRFLGEWKKKGDLGFGVF